MVARMALMVSLALVSVAAPICALAEEVPGTPTLVWRGPAGCPSGDLMERVAGLVGVQPEQLADKQLRVVAGVGPSASGGWLAKLHIETVAGSGERSFEAEDCGSLIKGAALVIALTVDPTVSAAPGESAPATADPVPPPSPTKSPRPRFLLRPFLAADLGVMPEVALATGGAVGVAWPSLRFEVDASYQSPQTVSDGRGRNGRLRAPLSSGARACWSPWRLAESLEPAACLGAGLTWLRSTGGDAIAFPETHDTLSVAVTGGMALGWRLRDWLWLRADASLGLSVRRPKLQVQSASQASADVYSVGRMTARIGGGVELRI